MNILTNNTQSARTLILQAGSTVQVPAGTVMEIPSGVNVEIAEDTFARTQSSSTLKMVGKGTLAAGGAVGGAAVGGLAAGVGWMASLGSPTMGVAFGLCLAAEGALNGSRARALAGAVVLAGTVHSLSTNPWVTLAAKGVGLAAAGGLVTEMTHRGAVGGWNLIG